MRDMTWCKLYTHLSWSWCMKKPNSGNSGVRNIVHSASPRCTIFRTPLLPLLGFFIHHSQERCVYTKTSARVEFDPAHNLIVTLRTLRYKTALICLKMILAGLSQPFLFTNCLLGQVYRKWAC